MRKSKIQIFLRIWAARSAALLGAFRITKDAKFLHADSEDSDRTARRRRLLWDFVGRTAEGMFTNIVTNMFISAFAARIYHHFPISRQDITLSIKQAFICATPYTDSSDTWVSISGCAPIVIRKLLLIG